MPLPLTRGVMRDIVRAKLGITPPSYKDPLSVDYNAIAGYQPAWAQWPTNTEINQALDEATQEINRRGNWRINTNITLTLAAQSANGVYYADLTSVIGSRGFQSVNEVQRVIWAQASTAAIELTATSPQELDNLGYLPETQPPATPQWYFSQGYQLGIYPAPNVAGTLTLTAGTALYGLNTDADTIEQLPSDYHVTWCDWAAAELAGRSALNVEYQAIAQKCRAAAETGIAEILMWKNGGVNRQAQPGFGFRSYRRGSTGSSYGGRR